MGDDGIGVRVVEELEKRRKSGCWNPTAGKSSEDESGAAENLRFIAGETDVEYCLTELIDEDACIIIDGCSTGNKPGTVNAIPLMEAVLKKRPAAGFHDIDLLQAMARENIDMEGILITAEISCLEFSTELSPTMNERFSEIVCSAEEIIGHYLQTLE